MNNLFFKSFLIICYQRLGDVLLTTPLIHSIKTKYPQSHIDVMVIKDTESVLLGNEDINNILIWDKKQNFLYKSRQLFSIYKKYDIAIAATANDRARIHAIIAGKYKIGFVGKKFNEKIKAWFLNNSIIFEDINLHTIQNINRLAKAIGIDTLTTIVPPITNIGTINIKPITEFLQTNKKKILIHPYPKFNYKKWDIKHWIELCKYLSNNGFQVGISGSALPEEVLYIEEIITHSHKNIINFSKICSLAQISEITKHADIYIGVDTVTTHIAASIGIPTIAIYGPTNPVLWGAMPIDFIGEQSPWPKRFNNGIAKIGNVVIIQSTRDCVPCHLEGCDRHINSFSKCLYDITADKVINEIKSFNLIPKN